jgi:signal peptidase I
VREFKIRVSGKSMLPFLAPSSLALVRLCGINELRKGDIAVYKSDNKYICHRVIGKRFDKDSAFLKTKADIFYTADPPVPAGSLVGRIVAAEHGRILLNLDSFMARCIGRLASLIIPAIVVALFKFKGLKWQIH